MQPSVHFIREPRSLHYYRMTKGSEGFPPHSLTSFSILRPLGLNKTMEPDLRLNSVVPLKIKFLQLPVNNFNPPKEYPKPKNEVLTDDCLWKILHWKNNYLFSSFFIPSSNFSHYVSWKKNSWLVNAQTEVWELFVELVQGDLCYVGLVYHLQNGGGDVYITVMYTSYHLKRTEWIHATKWMGLENMPS